MSDELDHEGNQSQHPDGGAQPFVERRRVDTGPPTGVTERRVLNQRLFDKSTSSSMPAGDR